MFYCRSIYILPHPKSIPELEFPRTVHCTRFDLREHDHMHMARTELPRAHLQSNEGQPHRIFEKRVNLGKLSYNHVYTHVLTI